MKRKIAVLLVSIACISLFLSGSSPKLIGEDEAKKAGLAFINKVFDANETDATVTLESHIGVSYIDGEYIATGEEQPVLFYEVTILNPKTGGYLYCTKFRTLRFRPTSNGTTKFMGSHGTTCTAIVG